MKTKKKPQKTKKKPEALYRCSNCGSDRVAEALWQDINMALERAEKEGHGVGPLIEGEELYYCPDCGEVSEEVNQPEE